MKYTVTGMTCAACSARVEKAVKKVPGVEKCEVNLLTSSMNVSGTADEKNIISAVEKAGYGASVFGQKQKTKEKKENMFSRLIWSVILTCALMYFAMGHMLHLPFLSFFSGNEPACALMQFILALSVILVNRKFFISGFKAVINGSPNMDTLVSLGSGISFVYSTVLLFLTVSGESKMSEMYFESSAMILTLIDVGKLLESYSKGKTADAVNALIKLKPQKITLLRNGREEVLDIEEAKVNDIFLVKAGESIPCDGVIVEGNGTVDESCLTGESIPVDKTVGDSVSAATVNKRGYMKCRATGVGEDTLLAGIIRTVTESSGSKAPIAKLADKVSGVFVPAVLGIALVTFGIWLCLGAEFAFALERGITVLVISCPCALGLATPVAIMVGSGVGAKNGILYKTATSLEEAGRIKNAVLDKTGTVTNGEPVVTDVFGKDTGELLRIAYALENKSEHPLAKAVVEYAQKENVLLENCTDIEILSGNGIQGKLNGKKIAGGNIELIQNADEDLRQKGAEFARQGKTPLYFSENGTVLGIIAVADTVRETSFQAIKDMKKMGINVYMLTGDNEITAREIGRQVGIENVIAGVLPDKKAEEVRKIKGKTAMIGDGINDAPALCEADLGIAIGNGTDIAIESADVVLLRSTLSDAVNTFYLGRKVLRNIKENLFWAFIYNCIGIPLAAGVFLFANIKMTPTLGSAAMSLSSFCVCMNALRLNLIRFNNKSNNNNNNNNKESNEMKQVIKVKGMMCAHCEARVKKAFEALNQVEEAVADSKKDTVVLTLNAPIGIEEIKAVVEKEGYTLG